MKDMSARTEAAVRDLRALLDDLGKSWPAETMQGVRRAWLATMQAAHIDGSIDALESMAEQFTTGGVLPGDGPFTSAEVAEYAMVAAETCRRTR